MNVQIANAPISYGVYGDIDLGDGGVDRMLNDLVAAGYQGTELGPPELFGSPQETRERLESRGLGCAGAYIPFHFVGSSEVFNADLRGMEQTLESLSACGAKIAVIADEGSELLMENPRHSPEYALTSDQWGLLFSRLEDVLAAIRTAGFHASFHPHVATFIESPSEIRMLLDNSDVDLTFDTGHILLGGGDVVACAREWVDRISHVHVKDVNPTVMDRAIEECRKDFNTWWADVSVPLGTGSINLDGFLAVLLADEYRGWLVVEQDRAPATKDAWPHIAAAQQQNFRWLHEAVNRSGSGAASDATGV